MNNWRKYALGILITVGICWVPLSVEPGGYFDTRRSDDDWIGPSGYINSRSTVRQCSAQNYEKNGTNPLTEGDSRIELVHPDAKILEEIRQIEYRDIKYGEENAEYYGFIQGKIPILISAPHGAPHYRRRWHRWRGEDEYTSSIAIELGKLTGAYVIYVKNKTREDPNSDQRSKYKMAVAKVVKEYGIKFLLDLHGSDEERPYKIDVGIINDETPRSSCPMFKEILRETFSGFEPELFNKNFCAKDACTLTSFARNELGIEAAQIEINAKCRIIERKPDSTRAKKGIEPHYQARPEDVLELMARLERTIYRIHQKIEEGCFDKVE